MVTKKSSLTKKKVSPTKKTAKKSAGTKANSTAAIENAVEKGVQKGLENSVQGVIRKHKKTRKQHDPSNHTGGFIWFIGFVGAAAYYISTATGFWNGLWGVIKALVWPAIVVFKLLAGL
ncbi:hypothetical protein K9M74_04005 [Candidatus Woesearchaeota archaeon]|nr:hypothetical protein [Candidatus Woesearchaeota archaeon]